MTDVFGKEKRSEIMSRNRGRGSKTTEGRLREQLEICEIGGWSEGSTEIQGKPDFVFIEPKIAIFVDGCFWHGCEECKNIPADNHEFWERKINKTRQRDYEVTEKLKRDGWHVIRIWEHQLKKKALDTTMNTLCRELKSFGIRGNFSKP